MTDSIQIKMNFDPDVAKTVGTDAAIILSNIEFWQAKNQANDRHCYEGQYWTYNSVKAFSDLFTYLSKDQIQRNLKKLEVAGFIQTGNFNSARYDRTKWYSSNRLSRPIEETESSDRKDETVQPIPDNKPDNKPDTFGGCSETLADRFARFYSCYPKKRAKADALKAFKKINPDDQLLTLMIDAVGTAKDSDGWAKDNGKYIPFPASWLRAGCWDDEHGHESAKDFAEGAI